MRDLTRSEKLVFGEDAKIDPHTNLPIEQGIGAATDRERAAQRAAEAAHSAEFERLQAAEKTLAWTSPPLTTEREQLLARSEAVEAAHAEAVTRAGAAEAAHTAVSERLTDMEKQVSSLTERAEKAEAALAAVPTQPTKSTAAEH